MAVLSPARRFRKNAVGRVFLPFLFLLLTGCSTVEITYNLAGWWIKWSIRDYVSLEQEQRGPLKQYIKDIHQWHRQTQLPLYADFLQQVQQTLNHSEVSPQELRQFAIDAQTLLEPTQAHAAIPLTRLLKSLTDEQTDVH